jgi:hypothetical protein
MEELYNWLMERYPECDWSMKTHFLGGNQIGGFRDSEFVLSIIDAPIAHNYKYYCEILFYEHEDVTVCFSLHEAMTAIATALPLDYFKTSVWYHWFNRGEPGFEPNDLLEIGYVNEKKELVVEEALNKNCEWDRSERPILLFKKVRKTTYL